MIDPHRQAYLMQRLRARDAFGDLGQAGLETWHENDWSLNPGYQPEFLPETMTPAAVLVGLIDRGDDLNILLTQRTAHLSSHAGQVAFPGGKIEPYDTSPVAAALREAQEEVGLSPSFVDVIGRLADYQTGTGFRVAPVVGIIHEGCALQPDPGEVAKVFEVPLSFVLSKANHTIETREYRGVERRYFAMDYDGHYIWGATAAILVNFCHAMRHYAGIE